MQSCAHRSTIRTIRSRWYGSTAMQSHPIRRALSTRRQPFRCSAGAARSGSAPAAATLCPPSRLVLAAPLQDCRVVIEAGDLKRNAPLRALVERAKNAAAITFYEDGERDIARLIDDEMRAADLTIAPDARDALAPLLGGDRRASRAEPRKHALYAQGAGRVELDDVLAVVADASALALDSLIDAAFAGDLTDVEKEFAKAQVAGTNPSTIIGGAIRHAERLHVLSLEIASGASLSDIVRRPPCKIHFRRQDAFTNALRAWTPERLARVMSMLAQTSLAARRGVQPRRDHRASRADADRKRRSATKLNVSDRTRAVLTVFRVRRYQTGSLLGLTGYDGHLKSPQSGQ